MAQSTGMRESDPAATRFVGGGHAGDYVIVGAASSRESRLTCGSGFQPRIDRLWATRNP